MIQVHSAGSNLIEFLFKGKTEQAELVILCGSSFGKPTNQLCDEFTAKTGINTSSFDNVKITHYFLTTLIV